MITDPGIITTALTAGGAPIWAAAIQAVIQVLKSVPQFEALIDGREKLLCFFLALVVTVLAFVASLGMVPPTASLDIIGVVAAFLAWFTLARLAMALYDDFLSKGAKKTRPSQSLLSAEGWTGPKP